MSQQSFIASFVVRLFRVEEAEAGEQGPWRVSVRHVQSGEEVRFTRLSDAMAFIEECAGRDPSEEGPCSEPLW